MNLELAFEDGLQILLESEKYTGDDENINATLRAIDGEGEVLCEQEMEAYDDETFEMGRINALGLLKIADAGSVEALKCAIGKMVAFDENFSEDTGTYFCDPECIDEDEEVEEDVDPCSE